jgi:aspartate/methionine/tyrosine aminotransferase
MQPVQSAAGEAQTSTKITGALMQMKYSSFSERAYARMQNGGAPAPVEALGQIYPDFGHRFRQQEAPVAMNTKWPLLDLGIGNYFACAPEIIEAAIAALRGGHSRYETVRPLKQAICAKFQDEHGKSLNDGNVMLLGGARPGMALSLLAGINPGDRVIIPDPDYIGLLHMASAIGAQVIRAPMTPDGKGGLFLDIMQLQDIANAGAAAIILTNPNNPTGNVLSRDHLVAISAISERCGAFVMVNEIYDKLVYDGQFTSYLAVGNPENSIVVGGTSKSYEMTGFGIGWLISSSENVAVMEDLAFLTHQSKPDAVSQYAALAALSLPLRDQSPARSLKMLTSNADLTSAEIDGYMGCLCPRPTAGQFAFPYVASDDLHFARFLLAEVALQVVPGSIWGRQGHGHFRLALANSAEHQAEGLSRLKHGIALYRKRFG